MRSYDEESFFHYPWRVHVFMLLPLTAATLFTALAFGWWGEPVRVAFAVLRTEYPSVTLALHLVTDFGNPLLYCGYVVLLAQAAHARDMGRLRDIACFAAISLLVLCVILQIVKYGLGIPRPGFPWPPQPWISHNYASFPSGHTANVIVSAIPLAIWIRGVRFRLLLSLLVACMGISRVWLGVHHPADIAGSIVFGSLAAWCVMRCAALPLFRRLHPSGNSEKAGDVR